MKAVEEIQAAIVKLTAQRDDGSRGPWLIGDEGDYITGPHATSGVFDGVGPWVIGDAINPEDADLIVTLHRTIDAQLAILSRAADLASIFGGHFPICHYDRYAIALARAINGPA
jgi:hypothetical protein